MTTKISKIFSISLLVIVFSLGAKRIYNSFNSQQYILNSSLGKRSDVAKQKFAPQFTKTKDGIENIAFISMVKDESDIIYENLIWHFAVGFRKFIVFDNSSTDNTLSLIKRFAQETKGLATVLIIEDPIIMHNQNKIVNSGYRMAHEIWPEVNWFFPVDADEFWVFSQEPAQSIAKIPNNIDVISAIKLMYRPSDDYHYMPVEGKFWHKIHYRNSNWGSYDAKRNVYSVTPKIFMRYSDNFSICMGNHHIIYNDIFSIKAAEDADEVYHNLVNDAFYDAADLYGIHLREFHIRSPQQAQKKFTNGLKAAAEIPATNKSSLKAGEHWLNYQKYLDNASSPEEAANQKFNDFSRPANSPDIIDDPLPIDEAIALYKQLCNLK